MDYIKAMFSVVTLNATFRLSAPLLLGIAGFSFSNKSGILNIALESFLTFSAFFSLLGSYYYSSEYIGAFSGIVSGVILSIIFGLFIFNLGANGLITGVAFNHSAWAVTTMLMVALFNTRGATSVGASTFSNINVPIINQIPIVKDIINNQTILVYIAPAFVILAHIIMYRTPFGLRIRSVGQNPQAAETAGISVIKYRWIAMIVSGMFMGLAGAFISLNSLGMYSEGMTAGRGFLVLASVLVANANPIKSMLVAFLFSYSEALTLSWSGLGAYSQVVQMLPYIVVILVLIIANAKNINKSGQI